MNLVILSRALRMADGMVLAPESLELEGGGLLLLLIHARVAAPGWGFPLYTCIAWRDDAKQAVSL